MFIIQGQDERESDHAIITLSSGDVVIPQHVGEAVVSREQDEHENEAQEREEDIVEDDEIGDDVIGLPDQEIRRYQHVWGAGVSLGRHPHNPHATDPVIHAESAAEAAEARSRLHTVNDEGNVRFVYTLCTLSQALSVTV